MEKLDCFYFNDMISGDCNQAEIMEEFHAYLNARCYSILILFDGLVVEPKVDIERNIYSWKVQINETLYIKLLQKTTTMNSNKLVEVEWEVWSKPEENRHHLYYLFQFIRKECEILDVFFHVRKPLIQK